jgi:hypothetical protein
MKAFATGWRSTEVVQQSVAQLPWGHVTVLLDKLDDTPTRDWYAQAAGQHGWSRCMLLHQIKAQTHVRVGAAPSNFAQRLPSPDSDLAHSCARAAGHRSAGVWTAETITMGIPSGCAGGKPSRRRPERRKETRHAGNSHPQVNN